MSTPQEPQTPQPGETPPPPPVQGQYSAQQPYQPQPGQPYQQYQYGTQPQYGQPPAPQQPQYAAPREPGGFSALFDMSFRRYATPVVAKFLYVIVLIAAALMVLSGLITGIQTFGRSAQYGISSVGFDIVQGLVSICAGALGALILLGTYRLVLEFFVTQFHAAGHIRSIAEKTTKDEPNGE